MHSCEGKYIVVRGLLKDKVPKTRRVYFENKSEIGMIDEVLGRLDNYVHNPLRTQLT